METTSMNKESIKYLLEGTAQTFKDLSEINAKDFEDTDDSFFKGKVQAYDIATRQIESLIKIFFNDKTSEQ